jgi:predicted deacylase
MSKHFIINGTAIIPGQEVTLRLPVGSLPSGNRIYIKGHIYRSLNPGPVMLALGGVHGDEINGIEIVRRAVEEEFFKNLQQGSVIAIPLLNIYGFINYSRDVPDGKDVNRSFPGSLDGSLAARVAFIVTKKILPLADFIIDFHTGGRNHYNYPQARFTKGDKASEELARLFGAPYILSNAPISHSLRKVAHEALKPLVVFEGGENQRYDGFSIEHGLKGLKRVMAAKGMIAEELAPARKVIVMRRSLWLRAPWSGMFRCHKPAGQRIVEGEPLGSINDPFGTEKIRIYAPRNGHILGHTNAPVVNQGDALFHIGY